MTFEKFLSKIVKAVDELEKQGRGIHNADIVEIIWKRVSNTELSQYITDLKVQFQHQPRNYRELLQDIASQVLSIGVDTLRKASGVSVWGQNREELKTTAFMTATGCYLLAHTLRKTVQ